MIDLNNIGSLEKALVNLHEKQQPVFGNFTAQHMVEHLAYTVKGSNGEVAMIFASNEEHLPALRAFLISDKQIREGAKAPFLGDELPALIHVSLDDAKSDLIASIKSFHTYFEKDATVQLMNPVFGMLNYNEWLLFHAKHFRHHFKQFELSK